MDNESSDRATYCRCGEDIYWQDDACAECMELAQNAWIEEASEEPIVLSHGTPGHALDCDRNCCR